MTDSTPAAADLPGPTDADRVAASAERALAGNLAKVGDKLAKQGKLFVRDRLALLLDEGSFVEDALLANTSAVDLPADGVVTGVGTIDGRAVVVVANDPTVKAGSWGARTVEKMIRAAELLSAGFPFARVDFYEIDGRPRFGEVTFYPGSGLLRLPDEVDLKYGAMWPDGVPE